MEKLVADYKLLTDYETQLKTLTDSYRKEISHLRETVDLLSLSFESQVYAEYVLKFAEDEFFFLAFLKKLETMTEELHNAVSEYNKTEQIIGVKIGGVFGARKGRN